MTTGIEGVFELVSSKIKAQGYFKSFDLWRDQLSSESQGKKTLGFPAVFIQFSDVEWQAAYNMDQKGDLNFTLHIGIKNLEQDTGKVFEAHRKIHEALHGAKNSYTQLLRKSTNQDFNIDKVDTWQVKFYAKILDENANNMKDYVELESWSVETTPEIEEDGDAAGVMMGGVRVKNTDESFDQVLDLGVEHTFPDVKIYDSTEENFITKPSNVDVVLPSGFNSDGLRVGIEYFKPRYSGNPVSYATGDAAYWANLGKYKPVGLPKPQLHPTLDLTTDLTAMTLLDNNVFGNKSRFTDTQGGQDYGSNNNIVLDHLTGKMIVSMSPNYDTNTRDWATWLGIIHAWSYGGFGDWRMPTDSECQSYTLMRYANDHIYPLAHIPNAQDHFVSNTHNYPAFTFKFRNYPFHPTTTLSSLLKSSYTYSLAIRDFEDDQWHIDLL